VAGAGTISPGGALDFKMAAALSASGMTQLAGGKGGIPFSIQGTASDPTFRPDIKGMVGSQLKGILGGDQNNPFGGLKGLFGKKKPQ